MGFRAALDILALLVCSGYCTIPLFWLMTHPFVERWRKLGRRAFLFLVPAWAVIIAIVFMIVWPFRSAHFHVTWFAWAPAASFFLLGFSIYSAAFRSFHHTQVSGLAEIEPGRHRQQLVTRASARACATPSISDIFARFLAGASVRDLSRSTRWQYLLLSPAR